MAANGNLNQDAAVFPPKGEQMPEFMELNLCQYHDDPHSQQFKAWYEGRADHPPELLNEPG